MGPGQSVGALWVSVSQGRAWSPPLVNRSLGGVRLALTLQKVHVFLLELRRACSDQSQDLVPPTPSPAPLRHVIILLSLCMVVTSPTGSSKRGLSLLGPQ